MNKLTDLVEANTVVLTSPSINALLEIPNNDVQAKLQIRTIVSEDTNFYDYVVHHHNTAALERHSDAILVTLMEYKGEDGRPRLYVANECFRQFYLSYITNRAFPFVEVLHVFMMHLVESGLPNMYYTWTSRSLGLDVTLPSMTSEPRKANKINISAQVIPFSLLFIGYFLSTVALVVELWMAKRTKLFPYLP
ncbi:uncharacterized protein [Choristoneura fumiferana]|uniref:uncharacterized protein n=1 Tax=Choristoneura fumiferana TaxID=7141 RepID=UPI003D1545A0